MTKYILQVGLDTELDYFPLMDRIKEMFSQDVENDNFKDTTRFKLVSYKEVKDEWTYLKGIENGSGGSDWLDKQWVVEHKNGKKGKEV